MAQKLNEKAFALALAIWSAGFMLLLGILGNMGLYRGATEMMQQWHMFYSLSAVGIIAGMLEAAIIGLVLGYIFIWLYNKLVND